MTDLLVELDNIDQINSNNYLFIIGHSFGGAITLSALNEVFLERVKSSHDTEVALNGFGEGTVIINPAIEANQILQLKEASMLLGSKEADQPKLLHVVSSKGDVATHRTFPLGQALGVLTWKHEDLERSYFGTDYTLSEYKLDVNTAGNYLPFHTDALIELEDKSEAEKEKMYKQFDINLKRSNEALESWIKHSYCSDPVVKKEAEYFPCRDNGAISFTYTTKSFIQNHNAVFNDNVKAYF